MKLSQSMLDALNDQIREELESAFIYFAMASYFDDQKLGGFRAWMEKQAHEELGHAQKFIAYIQERGEKAIIPGIKKPAEVWDSPKAAFDAAYGHEQHITGTIHDLVHAARAEKDLATENFLAYFVEEQREEEETAMAICDKLELLAGSPQGLYLLDRELSQRQ